MFQPVIPTTGYAGWRFLQRTIEVQQEAFSKSATLQRDKEHFQAQIGNIETADDLVSDRRLMRVALGAFGLDEDINNRFFIKKILSDGTSDPDALSNRLADKRYHQFSKSVGLADAPVGRPAITRQADAIWQMFEERQFDRAVGEVDNNLRLALNTEREIASIRKQQSTNTGQWFAVIGTPPLREVFEKAFGLPQGIRSIDIDRQENIFEERAQKLFGSRDFDTFASPDAQEKLIRLFLLRTEVSQMAIANGAQVALTLLT